MLNPETLYVVHYSNGDVTYGRTPDGEGMYWYDENQYDEAMNDVCPVRYTSSFETPREFDDFRYGPV